MATLKALRDLKPGDVIYLHPEHSKYDWHAMGIIANRGDHLTVAIGAEKAWALPDLDRCVEVISVKLLAACTGYTHRRIREACAEARAGKLKSLGVLGEVGPEVHDETEQLHESEQPHQSEYTEAELDPTLDERPAMADAESDINEGIKSPSWIRSGRHG